MAAGLRVGVAQFLYRNSATYASPTWNNIQSAVDVELGLAKSMATIKSRLTAWEQNLPALKKGPLTFGLLGDTSQDDFDVLRDAFIADTLLDLAIADGAIATSGTEYFRADFYLSDFPIKQKLEEGEQVDVQAVLAYAGSTHTPAFTNVP